MMKRNLFGLFGVSMACFMIVGAGCAAERKDLLYSFDVPLGAEFDYDSVSAQLENEGFVKDNQYETVKTKANSALQAGDLATELVGTANANAVKGIIAADSTVAKKSDLDGMITTSNIGNNIPNTVALKTDLSDYATSTELTTLNNKLPTMDASTGAITWTDPNGNSASYGGYTFWILDTYNKKISDTWFKCTTWTTDAPSSTWILEHEIQNLQCHNANGWVYGTNCLLDGTIETYNVSPAHFKYNLCKALKSGDINVMIDEQVVAKGYATQNDITSAVSGKLDKTELATEVGKLDLGYATQNDITSAVSGKLDKTELATEVGKLDLGYATQNDITNAVSGKLDKTDLSTEVGKLGYATQNDITSAVSGKLDKTELSTEVGKLGYATQNDITSAVSGKLDKTELATEVGKLGYVSTSALGSCSTENDEVSCTGLLGTVLNAAKAQTGKTSD